MVQHTDSSFDDLILRQIAAAYGPEVFDSPEFSTEPGSYLAARAAYEAEKADFAAALPACMLQAAHQVTDRLVADGLLPADVTIAWTLEEV